MNINLAKKELSGLPTGVTNTQIENFKQKCGESYIFEKVENYPKDGGGMASKITMKHKLASWFWSGDIEIGGVYAFSKEQAEQYFKELKEKLYA